MTVSTGPQVSHRTPATAPPPEADAIRGLRLLMVADSSSTHTHRWAQWFAGRGAIVSVLSPYDEPINGVEVVPFPGRRRWYHRVPKLRMLADFFPFRRLLHQLDPQLIHFHFVSEGGRTFYWNGIDVPMIASTWGQDVIFDYGERPKAQRSLRNMLARCRFITATTHQLAAATARYLPAEKPIHIIPFGVDVERFGPRLANPSGPVTLGFVKHLLPKYGPDVLIEAFSIIHARRPDTRLVLAGRGSLRDSLQQRVAELRLQHAVEILGRVPHERVPELIRSFDIMVMPSVFDSETFGVAAIEASACGVPVVASRVGGVAEAVIDGQTGLLVRPCDAQALARACIQLIDEPQRRRDMGAAGRRFVQRYYVWENNARQMEEIYRAALEGRAPRDQTLWRPGAEPELIVPPEDSR